jgi:hypothetical protein
MTDFIREVEEEYRRDKAIEAWKRYQNWIIALAILVVVAAGGWRYYQSQQKAAAEAAGARFEAAVQLGREGKAQDAEQAFLEIARTGPRGYAILSRFRAAAEIAQRNRAEAVTRSPTTRASRRSCRTWLGCGRLSCWSTRRTTPK